MALLFFFFSSSVDAFTTPRTPLQQLKSFIIIVQYAQSSDFDLTDDYEGGQALALEFSRELQARKEQAALEQRELSKSNRRLLSEEELRFLNNKPFAKRQEVVSEAGPSAGFFSGQGQSVYSFPLDAPPPPQQQDSNLMVGGPVSPLFIPTMAAIVLLSVYLTFAVTPDGMDQQVEDWNAVIKDVAIEQVVPTPSVYL